MSWRALFLPVFFGGGAAAIWYFNNVMDKGVKLVFPVLAYVPGYETIEAQADGTVKLFVGIAVASAVWSLFFDRYRPPGQAPD